MSGRVRPQDNKTNVKGSENLFLNPGLSEKEIEAETPTVLEASLGMQFPRTPMPPHNLTGPDQPSSGSVCWNSLRSGGRVAAGPVLPVLPWPGWGPTPVPERRLHLPATRLLSFCALQALSDRGSSVRPRRPLHPRPGRRSCCFSPLRDEETQAQGAQAQGQTHVHVGVKASLGPAQQDQGGGWRPTFLRPHPPCLCSGSAGGPVPACPGSLSSSSSLSLWP